MAEKIDSLIKYHETLKPEIQKHLSTFNNKTNEEKYKEFIFCLLTPQSNAKTCWEAVEILSKEMPKTKEEIAKILRGRARFHFTKAERVLKSKETWKSVKFIIENELESVELRNKVSNIVNGYGLKEAGHFLRNIGKSKNKVAILDRHILKNLAEYGAIKDTKIKNNKAYLALEQEALNFSEKTKIPIDELDLLFWHKEHGEFFK